MTRREVIVLTPAIDGADGISEVSRQMVAAIVADAAAPRVTVWALRGGAPPSPLLEQVMFRSAHGSRRRIAAWALARAGRPADAVLVVVLHVYLAPLAVPLAMRGAQLACFFHGIEVWRRLRMRERWALRRARVLMANSHWTATRFKEANPEFRDAEIAICHLGVPPPAEADPPVRRGCALIVGRLVAEERYKGHDVLIGIWPAVRQAVPSAELIIAGEGDDRSRLEALATSHGVSDVVHFAGRVSNSALAGLYRDAGFFVMPSTGEGFGLAYLEAMQAGKACIAGPGAAAEIIEDGVTGLIVDPSSPERVTAALVRLFREPETCAAFGRAGAARVHERFEARHFAACLMMQLSNT